MRTKEAVATGSYVLPRVNLLPPEIGERRAVRRSYQMMGVIVLAAIATAGFLYAAQARRVSAANKALAAEKLTDGQLRKDRAKLQPVQDAYLELDANESLLVTALARRISFSKFLYNASITIPDNVWLAQYTATVTPVDAPAVPATGTAPSAGTMSVTGTAYDYRDVANWLETVTRTPGYVHSYLTTAAAKTAPGSKKLVTFTSTAMITPEALQPYQKPAEATP